jgi:aryl-alcohol dehydrogenase-like predicted oxidoreductase
MKTRQIGDRAVSSIGLGGMPMSIEGRPDEARSINTIHAALEVGVTLFDTADAYHLHADEVGHNESLIAWYDAHPEQQVVDEALNATIDRLVAAHSTHSSTSV